MHDSTNSSKNTMHSSKINMDFKEIFLKCMQCWMLSPSSCYDNINESCHTALSFVDLRKAFDTASHETLLVKLSNYGIRGVTHNLIHSYLLDRQQFVSNKQSKSDLILIHFGDPKVRRLALCFFSFISTT